MVIYELTNKHVESENTYNDLCFSKYYAIKEVALYDLAKTRANELYKLELKPLNREDIASILSMEHVDFTRTENGYQERHDLSSITINKEKIKWETGAEMQPKYLKVK